MAQRITHKHSLVAWAVLSTISSSEAVLHPLYAAELNTNVPTASETGGFPVQINLPAQPLNQSIRQLANQTGLSISFDSELTKNKTAPAVKGFLSPQEALKKVLQGSGLQLNISGDSAVIKPEPEKTSQSLKLDAIEVRAKRFYEVGPLPGLGLTKEEIPGNVQSISAKEIKEAHSLSLTDLMNRKLQSVTVNDYQGNPFQMDVQYRGFTAGPQIGMPQGLSVFLDGIRVNEPFGDVVNWDMIPMNALAGVDVFPGSNPIFGLNTLGGAFSLKTKDGFNNAGVDADVLTGSFGRKQLQVEGGWNNGTIGLFAAGNFFMEDGWRKNSPSKVNQLFTKASFRGEKLDLNLSTLLVANDLVGNGLIPSEMYDRSRNDIFSAPDETKNRLQQFQLSGSYFVNDNFTITGQVYRRDSDRKGIGADVFTDYDQDLPARRLLAGTGEQFTCLFNSNGAARANGVPDYYVIQTDASTGFDIYGTQFFNDSQGYNGPISHAQFETDYAQYKNIELPQEFLTAYQYLFNQFKNFEQTQRYNRDNTPSPPLAGNITPEFNNEASYRTIFSALNGSGANPVGFNINVINYGDEYFYTAPKDANGNPVLDVNGDPVIYKNYVFVSAPSNNEQCRASQDDVAVTNVPGGGALTYDVNGRPVYVDGAGRGGTGVVEGTPTGIINKNNIKQLTDGASFQLNWNFEHHKFMVGASIDAAGASYENTSQLGFLDANRNVYLDPAQAHPQFGGAFIQSRNNDFEGTNTTKSIYFSETWTPVDSVHLNFSGRYNFTKAKNKIAARYGLLGNVPIGDMVGLPDTKDICNGNCVADPNLPNAVVDPNPPTTGYRALNITTPLDPAETEKFSFYSFNPSIGGTWQVNEKLNVFANVAQGTRTPSVIELGCALDKTPVLISANANPNDPNNYRYKSVFENRTCTLPTTLSGDPYLPQIRSTSYDIGMRGTFTENIQWNLGAYQTDLKDDIYFVSVAGGAGGGSGFFDTIGNTRRRGLEAGLSGRMDRWRFGVNYALTDATFQNGFEMISNNNSSARIVDGDRTGIIIVEKGDRMPGVSLHNLNASVNYEVTDKWTIGLSTVAHSDSFVRGNENNEHRQGAIRTITYTDPVTNLQRLIQTPPTRNPGKVDGYAVVNFQTSYRFNKEWTATMIVNNLLDKEYFSAGRLGVNPFSPSINGAIGPDGYNHNSDDWLSTNFIAPGAPRGVWFSLNWHFVPD
ncbi:TonB-dependent receptor domain-containing protein [Methylophilus sp. TWE2]|uniref:TonB-dependent receptor domain-containing protein n=1 Tax=Methylophilus sp. TWE2 TaxID=1662285 RepID=UPI000670DFA3|nr:TonB-dependent receptor [Methylophilus sp. TWE2]AKR42653.1 TonB-dependent receptor [Methylophilus sp. TWE2]